MPKKRPDGRYQMGFRYDGKQYTVYGKDRKEALEKKQLSSSRLLPGVIIITSSAL